MEALLLLLGSGLLTTMIYLYLNPAKPAKKVRIVTTAVKESLDDQHVAGGRDHLAAELEGRLGVRPQRQERGWRQVLISPTSPSMY